MSLNGEGIFAPAIVLQPLRTPRAEPAFSVAAGTFVDLEFLAEANTPGVSNGVGRAWLNGALCAERTDFMFFDTGDTPAFDDMFFDPTYGGGGNPPPENLQLDLIYWHRESAA